MEVRLTSNYGPHTKYYPYILSTGRFESPLVTADDDVLYSRWWLEGLLNAHRERPDVVNCYRAHVIQLLNGGLASYGTWRPCVSSEPSFRHFATGVSGCIYPAPFLSKLKAAGSGFLETCPKADDVWLHANALRAGFMIRQIRNRPLRFPLVPKSQASGLFQDNVIESQNDQQIRRTYTIMDLKRLALSEFGGR
jgi:hypothetical protein